MANSMTESTHEAEHTYVLPERLSGAGVAEVLSSLEKHHNVHAAIEGSALEGYSVTLTARVSAVLYVSYTYAPEIQ